MVNATLAQLSAAGVKSLDLRPSVVLPWVEDPAVDVEQVAQSFEAFLRGCGQKFTEKKG